MKKRIAMLRNGSGGTLRLNWIALVTALVLLLNAGLAFAEALPVEEAEAPFGSPWINGTVVGNLPDAVPEAVDDFYLNTNYVAIASLQDQVNFDPLTAGVGEPKAAVMALIADESVTGPDIDLLRVFSEQASSADALAKCDESAIAPYLEQIDAADSIEALNAVLLAEDFPFSPYIIMAVSPENMQGNDIVSIIPALSMSDEPMLAKDYYVTPFESVMELLQKSALYNQVIYAPSVAMLVDTGALPPTPGQDEVLAAFDRVIEMMNLEISYTRECMSTAQVLSASYGTASTINDYLTLEELDALCPSFPLSATLKKYGKGGAERFCTPCKAWLKALDALWTEDNLQALKSLTKFKVAMECAPFMDPELFNGVRQIFSVPPLQGMENAYAAMNKMNSFAPLLAKLYAEQVLGDETRQTLTQMTHSLVDAYRDMIDDTDWISDSARQKTRKKLDQMHLNILAPESGYIDFSGLELTSASEGGTLLDSYLAIKAYRNEWENQLIGQPATPDLVWRLTSPNQANAFYDPESNSINILPGFIHSGSYRADSSPMELLGTIGTAVAHEMSHGFDFLGSQYDAWGRGAPILEAEDRENFLEQVEKIVDCYNGIWALRVTATNPETGEPFTQDLYVDGSQVQMEATADLMGLKAAALVAVASEDCDMEAFFRAYAGMWLNVTSPEMAAMLLQADTHPLNYLRVNICSQMLDVFYDTFGVQEGDGMYVAPEDRLNVWGK